MIRRVTNDPTLENLWKKALAQLNDDEKERLDITRFNEDDPADKLREWIGKQRDDQARGRREKVRRIYGKVVACINKFKLAGDFVVQYDPAHAALPWAAVRFVLQAAVSEHELYTSLLESLEYVAEVITRSAWMETLYLSAASTLRNPLQDELINLYVAVLRFLGEARQHYTKHALKRALRSLAKFDEKSVENCISRISELEGKVKRIAELIDSRFIKELSGSMNDGFQKTSEQNEKISQQIADLRVDLVHGKSQDVADPLREDVLKWIDATSSLDDFKAAQQARKSDTCEWIFECKELQDWLDTSLSRKIPKVLWICGKPGAGKTIISARLADHLQETSLSPFAYFFCFYGNERKRSCLNIVRSWISQLVKGNDEVLHVVAEFYRRKESDKATEFELWQAFRQINATIDSCIYLLDGFDECDNEAGDYRNHSSLDSRAKFLSKLNDSLRQTYARVVIMSRPDVDVQGQWQSNSLLTSDSQVLWKAYNISPRDTSQDVRAFAQHIINQKLPKKSDKLRNELADKAIEKAEGMFLWIKLLQKRLSGSKTSSDLRRIIEDTPSGLEKAYERDLLQISKLEPGDRNRAVAILRWIIYAKRPLTVRELAEALLVDLGKTSLVSHERYIDFENDFDNDEHEGQIGDGSRFPRHYLRKSYDEEYVQHEIFRLFGSLIELREKETVLEGEDYESHEDKNEEVRDDESNEINDDVKYEEEDNESRHDDSDENEDEDTYGEHTIHFVHFSVQEYLLEVKYATLQRHRLTEPQYSQERLMQVCLKYLCYNDFQQKKESSIKNFQKKICNYAFLPYAAVYWGRHASDCKPLCSDSIHLCNKLLDPSGFRWLSCFVVGEVNAMGSFEKFISQSRIAYPSPLYHASLWGITETMQFLIDQDEDINHEGGLYGSSLSAAAAHGHQDAASLLIKKKANINSIGGLYGTAVQTAAAKGNVKVLETLLHHKADVNLKGGWLSSPAIVLASKIIDKKRSELVIRLLIKAGADLNAEDADGWTALFIAACSGSMDVIKLLVDNNTNLKPRNTEGITPLIGAIVLNRNTVTEYLLQSGADLNLQDQNGLAPIQFVMESYERQAKGCAKDASGRTAWHTGLQQSAICVEPTLLNLHTVKIGLEASPGMTALHFAVVNNYARAIELLITHGANVNATDKNGATPLHFANQNDNGRAIELLLSHDANVNAADKNGATSLHFATQDDNDRAIELLLSHDANVNAADKNGATPLHWATHEEHSSSIELLLIHDANANAADNDGSTPLHSAIQGRDNSAIELLIAYGANVNAVDKNGATPLHLAVIHNYESTIKLLLAHEANVNAADNDGLTPLHWTIRKRHNPSIELLIAHGANVNAAENHGFTSLHWAIHEKNNSSIELLIARGVNVNAKDKEGCTPLHWTIIERHNPSMKLLIAHGANVNSADNDGRTSLHRAIIYNYDSTIKLLLAHEANVNAADNDGQTPLHLAVEKNHNSLTMLLIAHGANVNAADKEGCTPLHSTIEEKHNSSTELLIAHGANVNAADNDGLTSLHCSVMENLDSSIELLLAHGANVNAADNDGLTSLHFAAEKNQIELLIAHGANVNAADNDGLTSLHFSVMENLDSSIELLLAHGANFNAASRYKDTPLHLAVKKNHDSSIELLIVHDANVNAANSMGYTPLHLAAIHNHNSAMKLLLAHDANVNAASQFKDTPLHLAVEKNHDSSIELLIAHDANVNAVGAMGYTPLHLAAIHNNDSAMKLLLAHDANVNAESLYEHTPLYLAVGRNHGSSIELLIAHGANVNAARPMDYTPLHSAKLDGKEEEQSLYTVEGEALNLQTVLMEWEVDNNEIFSNRIAEDFLWTKEVQLALHKAVISGRKQMAELLIKKGALVNAKDYFGSTPLHEAVREGDFAKVLLLLGYRADVQAKDNDGDTPLMLAVKVSDNEDGDIIKLLRIYEQHVVANTASQ